MENLSLYRIEQRFDHPAVKDIEAEVAASLNRNCHNLPENGSIAVTVGSRGVNSIDRIAKAAVDWLKSKGCRPFIVPAMGSHGNAIAEGQKAILAGYGVTEAAMGCPVRATMETVRIDVDDPSLDNHVIMDKYAYEADGVIPINRIKVHTDFHGLHESGLMKMLVIGLGNHRQALKTHTLGLYGLKELIVPTARHIIKTGRILGGIGIVENGYDRSMVIEFIPANEIETREAELLEISRRHMPSLPVDSLDILIVDALGKNISGSGMDTNIIGRIMVPGQPEPDRPRINAIGVCDVTEESHGNAIGLGLADVITRRLYNKIDFAAMYENTYTSAFSERVKVPVVAEDDADLLRWVSRFAWLRGDRPVRLMRVKNTLEISTMLVSAAVKEELQDKPFITVTGETVPLLDSSSAFPGF